MKRNILLSIIFILTVVSFASCSFETDTIDGDGKIEGFWHMERIDTLVSDSAGVSTVVATKDLSRELLFWSFQHKLLELSDKNLVYTNVLYNRRRTIEDWRHIYLRLWNRFAKLRPGVAPSLRHVKDE